MQRKKKKENKIRRLLFFYFSEEKILNFMLTGHIFLLTRKLLLSLVKSSRF